MDYRSKYLKYKQKYLSLKMTQTGGNILTIKPFFNRVGQITIPLIHFIFLKR